MTEQTPNELENELLSLTAAAQYAKVQRQAFWLALEKGRLKAVGKHVVKGRRQWMFKKSDIDEYRKTKYDRQYSVHNGDLKFCPEKNRWSVGQVSKYMSVPANRIYYLVRSGQLKSYRVGTAIILKKEDFVPVLSSDVDGRLKEA